VLRDHWLTAQGQWAIAYDNLQPIVYISSGLAPKSARQEEGGQGDLTTDTTASSRTSPKTANTTTSSERIAYTTKFTSKNWYSSQSSLLPPNGYHIPRKGVGAGLAGDSL
jgi:hypothetical protein